jgi:hypothetical protein
MRWIGLRFALLLCLASSALAGGLTVSKAQVIDIPGEAGKINAILVWQLTLAPAQTVLDALDASVPLHFEIQARGGGQQSSDWVSLRYARMLQRYELVTSTHTNSFRLKAELFDALADLKFAAATQAQFVRIRLSLAKLPAPLRLPALLDSDWTLNSGWVAIDRPAP